MAKNNIELKSNIIQLNTGWRAVGGFNMSPANGKYNIIHDHSFQINDMYVSEKAKMSNLLFASLAVWRC